MSNLFILLLHWIGIGIVIGIADKFCPVSSLLSEADNTLPYPDIYVSNDYLFLHKNSTYYNCKSFPEKANTYYIGASNQTLQNYHKCIGLMILCIKDLLVITLRLYHHRELLPCYC